MSDTPIELQGIVKSYGKKHVLTGLDLAVPTLQLPIQCVVQ